MSKLEKGSVKFFNGADDKRFGFIIPEGKNPGEDDVFFHYNGFRKFEAKGWEVVFSQTGYDHPASFPKKDEQVWFARSVDHRTRTVAEPWGYNHDYRRVNQDVINRPKYGSSFIYISLFEGNLPIVTLEKYGTLTGIPEEERTQYYTMMYRRGFNGRFRFTCVIPNPGMEKKIGRVFHQLSYDDGPLGTYYKTIEVVEIPKQYEYTGLTEARLIKSARCLSVAETQKLVAMGKSLFTRSDYWGSWERILGHYEDQWGSYEVSVALTPVRGWEEIKNVSIYVRSPGHSAEKHEGPFTMLPDTVKEDMEEALGVCVAKELLSDNYLEMFTIERLQTAVKNHTGGGGLKLEEITGVKFMV